MWRLVLIVVITGLVIGACGDDAVNTESEFRERMEALRNATFKVTYSSVVESPSPSNSSEGQIIWYRQGPAGESPRERFDLQNEILINAVDSYQCVELAEGPMCVQAGCCRQFTPTSTFERTTWDDGTFTILWSRSAKISNIEAECYTVEREVTAPFLGPYEVCLSDDGLLLSGRHGPYRTGTSSDNIMTITAINLLVELPGDAFEPPYPVLNLRD